MAATHMLFQMFPSEASLLIQKVCKHLDLGRPVLEFLGVCVSLWSTVCEPCSWFGGVAGSAARTSVAIHRVFPIFIWQLILLPGHSILWTSS